MADKKIYIDDSPKNPDIKKSPFDWTYTTNITGRFGKVNCAMMKYLPPNTKIKVKPYFAFDMMPLVFPVQTNVRCHLKFYKVPLRILWKDFEDFASQLGTNGLPTNGGGTQFVVPYIKRPTGWNAVGSLAEQIGCCNRRLTEVTSMKELPSTFVSGTTLADGTFIPVTLDTCISAKSIFFPLPIGQLLKNSGNDVLDEITFHLSTISRGISVSGSGNGFLVNAYVYDREVYNGPFVGSHHVQLDNPAFSRDAYRLIATHTITTTHTSNTNYNNETGSCLLYPQTSLVTINDEQLTKRDFYAKIVDDSFFTAVNQELAQDKTVFISITPSGPIVRCFFPNNIGVPTTSITNKYTKISKDEQDNIEYSDASAVLINSIGASKSVEISTMSVQSAVDTKFDSINNADPEIPIPALPFRALEFIHNYFMRNPRIDPFVKDGIPTYNRFITNDGSGADSTTPIESWNALYETDYFTSCVKEPQFGNAPLVGATVNDTSTTGILTFGDGTDFDNYVVKLNADADGNVAPLTVYPDNADKPTMDRLNEMINFGISINDLRNVSTFQRMLERMQRTSYRFANVIYEFFGTNPPVGDHYPQYLGGVTRNVSVDKITNVAESDGHPLGSFAGQGKFRGEGESISVFASEPCYLVAIQYFTVTPTYSQYLPKHLLYKSPLDFYLNPEFAFMGPQPVYKGEVAPNQVSAEHFFDIFGYNRPYAELFGNVDEVHGLYKTDMTNYLLQRFFGDAPELNKSFIEINAADLTNIFSLVKNTDKMFGQILFKCSAQLPAPRSYLPRSI